MGLLKKIFRPVQKVVKKIVPKEIRPALPFIAAAFGPATAGLTGTSLAKALAQRGLIAGGTRAAIDEDASLKDILRTSALTVAPQAIGAGIQAATPLDMFGDIEDYQKFITGVKKYTEPSGILQTGKLIAGQTAIDASAKLAEINEKELADYEASLVEKGIRDKESRRSAIFNIYTNAGYGSDYVNSVLDKYGYADGGQVLMASAPDPMDELNNIAMMLFGKPLDLLTDDERDALDDYNSGLMADGGIVSIKPQMLKGAMSIEEFLEDYIEREKKKKNKESKANGGRVGFKAGGTTGLLALELYRTGNYSVEEAAEKARELMEDKSETLSDYLGMATSGLQNAFGVENLLQGEMAEPMRIIPGFKDGGIGSIDPDELPMSREGSPKYYDEKGNEISLREIEKRIIEESLNDTVLARQLLKKPQNLKEILKQLSPKFKDGGIMNLGGKEMDMRGGGFIPIGAKEKADDVPARLSKNEFVMTADAVRAAGGGNVNKGAKRMYQLMNKLEARA